MRMIVMTTTTRSSYGRSAGLRLDTADLVHVVLHQLGVVELEVSVHGTLPKKLVVVVELILTSLNHGEVLAVLGVELVVAALDDGELADVVVDRLLAGRCPLQQSDGVVWSVDIVEGCMRLPSACHYVLHQVHSGHRWPDTSKRGNQRQLSQSPTGISVRKEGGPKKEEEKVEGIPDPRLVQPPSTNLVRPPALPWLIF